MTDISGLLLLFPETLAVIEPWRSDVKAIAPQHKQMLMLKEAVPTPTDPITVFTLLAFPVTANSHINKYRRKKKWGKGLVLNQSIALFPLTMRLHEYGAERRQRNVHGSNQAEG